MSETTPPGYRGGVSRARPLRETLLGAKRYIIDRRRRFHNCDHIQYMVNSYRRRVIKEHFEANEEWINDTINRLTCPTSSWPLADLGNDLKLSDCNLMNLNVRDQPRVTVLRQRGAFITAHASSAFGVIDATELIPTRQIDMDSSIFQSKFQHH